MVPVKEYRVPAKMENCLMSNPLLYANLVGGCIEKAPSANGDYVAFIPISNGTPTGGGGS